MNNLVRRQGMVRAYNLREHGWLPTSIVVKLVVQRAVCLSFPLQSESNVLYYTVGNVPNLNGGAFTPRNTIQNPTNLRYTIHKTGITLTLDRN